MFLENNDFWPGWQQKSPSMEWPLSQVFYSIKVENKGEDLRVVSYYQYGNILLFPGGLQGCYMCHQVLNQGGENFSINGYDK